MQLAPGDIAPPIQSQAVQCGEIVDLTLEDALKGAEYLMLVFYPADFTFVCPTEIIQFMDKHAEFKEQRCNVVCCSTDSVYTHLAWLKSPKSERGLGGSSSSPLVLLSDRSHQISSAYGVLADNGAAYRGTFLIDQNKIIRQVTINDMPVGRSVDDALRMLTDLRLQACTVSLVQEQMNSSNVQQFISKPHQNPKLLMQRRQPRAKDLPQALSHSSVTDGGTSSGAEKNKCKQRNSATQKQQLSLEEPQSQHSFDSFPHGSHVNSSILNFSSADKQRRGLAERAAELEILAAQLRLRDSEERLSRIKAQVERLREETERQRVNTERLKVEAQLRHSEWDRLFRLNNSAAVLGGDVSIGTKCCSASCRPDCS